MTAGASWAKILVILDGGVNAKNARSKACVVVVERTFIVVVAASSSKRISSSQDVVQYMSSYIEHNIYCSMQGLNTPVRVVIVCC